MCICICFNPFSATDTSDDSVCELLWTVPQETYICMCLFYMVTSSLPYIARIGIADVYGRLFLVIWGASKLCSTVAFVINIWAKSAFPLNFAIHCYYYFHYYYYCLYSGHSNWREMIPHCNLHFHVPYSLWYWAF